MKTKCAFALIVALLVGRAAAVDMPFFVGGDISALPDLERMGAVYRDNGKPGDCIAILHDHGANLFRVRLFVNPASDFDQTGGATQDLPMVLALAKRIKASGAKFSLALHYSDTWADPGKQTKPAAWKDLLMDQLQKQVTDYTAQVMTAMKSNGTVPDIVEVGNETRTGMLWPDGKLDGKTQAEKDQKWENFIALLNAGIAGVRTQLSRDQTRVLIHLDSGGRGTVSTWFYGKLQQYHTDYDIIGLSFYPTWGDSLDQMKKNLIDLAALKKDVLIIETGYPYKPMKQRPTTTWPMTPDGQRQFMLDLTTAVKATPEGRGIGVVWWYPEAQALPKHRIFDNAALSWFDEKGELLLTMPTR